MIYSLHLVPKQTAQTFWERIDWPVVAVNFLRILTTIQPLPYRWTISSASEHLVPSASGQNMTPSPVLSPEITANPLNSLDLSSVTMRCFRWSHHIGELKRWQITVEHNPSIFWGTTVGSWVAITVRIPRCRCCLITEKIEWTNGVDVSSVRYYRLA